MRVVSAMVAFTFFVRVSAYAQERVSLAEIADHAVQQSKLTLPGSKPFHLRVEMMETTNPSSEYRGTIEQYWISPDKWRRVIDVPGFSQVLIVNGNHISEKDTGDYFPWWLKDLVTATVDPLPILDILKQSNAQILKPHDSEKSNSCADLRTKIDRWVICFEGTRGLLTSVLARGYDAEFADFQTFDGRHVARSVTIDPEPGTHIQARVTELKDLGDPDEAMFSVSEDTPEQMRITAITVDDSSFRQLGTGDTNISWPAVGGGPLSGKCAVYVSVDRKGQVREAWPAGCDNSGLQDFLCDAIRKWHLKPALENGVPVQIEALLPFQFETALVEHPNAKLPGSRQH